MDERAATMFRRRGVGIVFQQFNLIPTLTAKEKRGAAGDALWR
jgi:ABC-type lipoprotein export system ATPase subunit